jgi:hypothetical protein
MELHVECWNCGRVEKVVGSLHPQRTAPLYPEELAEAAFAAGYDTYRDIWGRLLLFCSKDCMEELVSKTEDRTLPKERPIQTGTGRYPE